MLLLTHDKRPELVELLTLLQEEAAEIIQASSKIIRFGMTEVRDDGTSNVTRLRDELTDLMTIVSLLTVDGDMVGLTAESIANPERVNAKLMKISKYTTYWKQAADHVAL
jgi:NTP pyrophosphatase (non-canonical NTP hydrolase)